TSERQRERPCPELPRLYLPAAGKNPLLPGLRSNSLEHPATTPAASSREWIAGLSLPGPSGHKFAVQAAAQQLAPTMDPPSQRSSHFQTPRVFADRRRPRK